MVIMQPKKENKKAREEEIKRKVAAGEPVTNNIYRRYKESTAIDHANRLEGDDVIDLKTMVLSVT